MLKIIGLSDKPCFLTGATEDVVEVRFADRSFSGSLSWNALLDVVKRRAAEAKEKTERSITVPTSNDDE